MHCVCAGCMDKLERLRWVSVKERLPGGVKYNGTVLATDGGTVITAPSSSVTPTGAITHWMPLPSAEEIQHDNTGL